MHRGVPVSPGVVVGVAQCVETPFGPREPVALAPGRSVAEEVGAFEAALAVSAAELETIVEKVGRELGESEADIFRSHHAIAHDPTLAERVRAAIGRRGLTAASAMQAVLEEFAGIFARSDQDVFRERMADLRDVLSRVASHLSVAAPRAPAALSDSGSGESIVLVAHEILPSQAMSLGELPIAGIVTEIGGGTSHAAILSRSRGIPAVSGVVGIASEIKTGDLVIVDGREGLVIVRPDAEVSSAYRKIQREFFQLKHQLILNRDRPAVSSDGTAIELLSNINTTADARTAREVGSTGVGLYRTEYLFLTHPDVPDEEEQYRYYRDVIEAAPNRTVTIRTLDLGGDKTVSYMGRRHEANPFMGWRSIRLSLEHPRFFERQIRAILRAGIHGRVSMLYPMITTVEELRQVNKLVEDTKGNLRRDGIPFGPDVKTGVMIEVPAAAVCIDALLRETDFISIGSNDLIQYLMAADRDNPQVARLCDPLNPAILRVLQQILEACRRTGTPVTLCGEMAGQPRSVLVLFGMGLRRFSMSPAFVPTIKALVEGVSTTQAERLAHQVLQMKTSEEIRKYLSDRLREVSRDLEMFDPT